MAPISSVSRRDLLKGGTVAAFALTWRYRSASAAPTAPAVSVALSEAERSTLEAAQEQLLPSGPGSPGAREVRAIDYLVRELAGPDVFPTSRERVKKGAARLDALAGIAGARSFVALPEAKQVEVLHAFELEDEAPEWFETMLDFTLEAFLGDPVHGGNPNEVAWRWLEYTPGFPRPTPAP